MLCSSFSLLNNVAFARYARNVNARAQLRRVFGRVVFVVLRYTYICIVKERKKEEREIGCR